MNDALGQDANAGTSAVRDAYRFDEAALARWIAGHVEIFQLRECAKYFSSCRYGPD